MDKKSFAKVYSALSKENITVKDSLKNIDEFLRILEKALLIDGQVKLVEKGVFEVIEKKPRKISNPQTREKIEIHPRKNLRLRVSKCIKFS